MMISLDGYFEGMNHDLRWHNAANQEFVDFADKQLDEADTLIFGHTTYEMMASFWQSKMAMTLVPTTAKRMNELKKVVFSKEPLRPNWQNTEASTHPKEYIGELKKKPGKDIAVLGSSNLSLTLLEENLLDELRIMISPIVIGRGTPLFSGLTRQINLELKQTRQFNSGNVLLTYVPLNK